jgi:hypothetical protein
MWLRFSQGLPGSSLSNREKKFRRSDRQSRASTIGFRREFEAGHPGWGSRAFLEHFSKSCSHIVISSAARNL